MRVFKIQALMAIIVFNVKLYLIVKFNILFFMSTCSVLEALLKSVFKVIFNVVFIH